MLRYDSAPIKARFDEAGYLRDEPVVARTGILKYRNADGTTRNELRLPEDVFNADSLESFAGMPITIGHAAMVNAKNHREHSVGTVIGSGRQDEWKVRAPVIVQDDRAIELARAGKLVELSVGYKCNYQHRAGWYNEDSGEAKFDDERGDGEGDPEGSGWVRFDGVQRDIVVNHVAMVRKARAGSIARLNLDGDEELDYHADDFNPIDKVPNMQKIRLDSGAEVEVQPEVAAHVAALVAKASEASTRADSLNAEKTALEARADTLQSQVDGFDAKLEQARNDAAEAVKARAELEATATKFGVTKFDGVSDLDLKKEVIAKTSKVNLDGKDENYIQAVYDTSVAAGSTIGKQRQTVNAPTRADSADTTTGAANDARAKMLAKMKGAK